MPTLREEKTQIRKECSSIRGSIANRPERDACICTAILSLASFRYADDVLLYYPIKSEASLLAVAQAALSAGKRVAFPRCSGEHEMDFHYVSSADELKPGSFGVPEPAATAEIFDRSNRFRRSVCFVPALAYDKRGYRIGYGRGYYDRWLSGYSGAKIGVTYSELIKSSLPHSRYDLRVDVVVSDGGLELCHE